MMRAAWLIAIIADVVASQIIADAGQYALFLLAVLVLLGVFAVARQVSIDRFR